MPFRMPYRFMTYEFRKIDLNFSLTVCHTYTHIPSLVSVQTHTYIAYTYIFAHQLSESAFTFCQALLAQSHRQKVHTGKTRRDKSAPRWDYVIGVTHDAVLTIRNIRGTVRPLCVDANLQCLHVEKIVHGARLLGPIVWPCRAVESN